MDLKGLKLTLDMDIDKFKSGVNAAINTTKDLDDEIKSLKKAFKFDPSDIQIYTKYISDLQTKFNKLEEVYTYLSDRLKNAEVGSERWLTLKTALADVGSRMELVNKEIADAQDLFADFNTTTSVSEKNIDKVEKALEELGDEFDDTKEDIEDVSEELNDADKNASTFGDTLTAILTSDVIKGGLNLLKNALDWVWEGIKSLASGYVDLMKQGIEYNAEMEKYTVSLHAIAEANNESTKSTDKLITRMKKIGQTSSFSASALLQASQQLMASGISAQEAGDSIANLQKLLAYAGKGDDELTRMAQNLNQIKNAGKATAQDLKQFAYAGVPVYKLLADYSDDFKEITKETVVQYKDLAAAFAVASDEASQYFNANEIQLQTFSGQVGQLKSQWDMLLGALTEDTTSTLTGDILPTVNDFLGNLIKAVEDNEIIAENASKEMYEKVFYPKGVQSVADVFKQGINDVLQAIMDSDLLFEFVEAGIIFLEAINTAFDPSTEEGQENLLKLEGLISRFTDEVIKLIDNVAPLFKSAGERIGAAIANGVAKGIADNIDPTWAEAFSGSFGSLDFGGHKSGGWGNSGGFGALQSGGYGNQITLNASFVANGNLDESQALRFADLMTERINQNLGGMI